MRGGNILDRSYDADQRNTRAFYIVAQQRCNFRNWVRDERGRRIACENFFSVSPEIILVAIFFASWQGHGTAGIRYIKKSSTEYRYRKRLSHCANPNI